MNEQSKAGHAPGPWSVGCPNGKRHYIMKSGYVIIAELPHVQSDSAMVIETYQERSANAALIAAAPDLLQALEDAEFMMRKAGQIAGPMQDSFRRSAEDARAALSKAKGTA